MLAAPEDRCFSETDKILETKAIGIESSLGLAYFFVEETRLSDIEGPTLRKLYSPEIW